MMTSTTPPEIPTTFKDDRRFCAPQGVSDQRVIRVIHPVLDMRPEPSSTVGIDTQLLYGESVKLFDRLNGYALVQNEADHYVGWVKEDGVSDGLKEPTHFVAELSSFVYPEPELRAPILMSIPMGAGVVVTGEEEKRGTRYVFTENGAMIAKHLLPIGEKHSDWVSIAESMTGIPYLWGGRSTFGLDCSAIVQIALARAGIFVLRDSDMQAASVGDEIGAGEDIPPLQRGDLIFWRGHVGIMRDGENLLHANGHTMNVASEPVVEAIERIAYLYERPTSVRRIS